MPKTYYEVVFESLAMAEEAKTKEDAFRFLARADYHQKQANEYMIRAIGAASAAVHRRFSLA